MTVRAPVILLLLFLVGAWPAGASALPYLDELVARATEMNLAARIEWHNLVHYKPNLVMPGVHSLADDRGFFNAPDGKVNPQAELEATLAAFFRPLGQTAEKEQPPACRFIARYVWLNEQLGFDPARLAPVQCQEYAQWRAALNPHEITLIFAAAYLNNPASMYGHTLLRVDAADQDERTRLLAYAINYAASTTETHGLIFAMRGLFGGYPGQFTIAPYYIKVREYSDLEHRDVWEYRLNFTPAEIDRMLMHIWELGPTYFDYYFFDENCAYHLLSVFEVARSSLNLTDRFRWWAIPSDTVRAVVEQEGLLKEAVYRPAAASILRARMGDMPHAQREIARDIAERRARTDDGRLGALTPDERAAVIETAYGFADYRRLKNRDESPETGAYLRELLLARSALPPAQRVVMPQPATRPEQGHPTSRIDLGVGRVDGRDFAELRARPTYHDVLDPEAGYGRGAQIEFFATRVRYYEDGTTRLEELTPLDILSLTPRDEFIQPLSWRVSAGWQRLRLADGNEPLVARVRAGSGLSWLLAGEDSSLVSVMLEGELDSDGALDNDYSLGGGPALMWLASFTKDWRAMLSARHMRFGAGELHSSSELMLAQRLRLGKNDALALDLVRLRDFGESRDSVRLAWQRYF